MGKNYLNAPLGNIRDNTYLITNKADQEKFYTVVARYISEDVPKHVMVRQHLHNLSEVIPIIPICYVWRLQATVRSRTCRSIRTCSAFLTVLPSDAIGIPYL